MAEQTNTRPDDELFDIEGEATVVDDDALGGLSDEDPGEQVVNFDDDAVSADDVAVVADVKSTQNDENESYGKKVQARINRLTGTHLQELGTRDREIADLQSRVAAAECVAAKTSVEHLEARRERITADLKIAKEEGQVDTEMELTDELLDVKAELREFRGRVPADGGDPAASIPATSPATPPAASTDPYKGLAPKAKAWAETRNMASWTAAQRGLMYGIDAEIAKEGFDQSTDDYFTELDRRIEVHFPELYADPDGLDDDPSPKPKPTLTPTVRAPSPTPPKEGGRRGNTVTLNSADYVNMRKFKLDPTNPEHVKAYAAEKR